MSGGSLVLGIGNVLAGDDAAGPRVVSALVADGSSGHGSLPAGTRLVDGGTAGIALLPVVAGADRLVVVDAADPAGTPGRVTVARGRAAVVAAGVAELGTLLQTAALAGVLPADITLVTIEAATLEPGSGMSAGAAEGVRVAVTAVAEALAETRSAVR